MGITKSQQETTTTATARLRAITRELANQRKAKGERIDVAVRRLGVLADDMDAGVEVAE